MKLAIYRARMHMVMALAFLVAGCNTEDELNKQRLDFLKAEEAGLKDLKAFLDTKPVLDGPGSVDLFVSTTTIDSVLSGAKDVTIAVPQVKGVTVTVKSIRADFKLGYPAIAVSASATKEGLGAVLALTANAHIEPIIDPANPTKLQLRIYVDSVVPKVTWGVFDFEIRGFVRDLAQVQVNDEIRNAGSITVPIEESIPLNLPAGSTTLSFPGIAGTLNTPQLSLSSKIAVTRVLTLPDGIHVLAKITI